MDSPKARALDDPLITGILDTLTKLAGIPGTGPFTPRASCAPADSPRHPARPR